MANRRMFSKNVARTDAFLDMSQTAQNLYFHLGIDADDDGFVSPKLVMRMIGSGSDDLKILVAKGFVIPFDDGVIVIRHWRINNEIRSDRYKETQYKNHKEKLAIKNNIYDLVLPTVLPVGDKMDTQVRLGKVRLGKVRLGKREQGGVGGNSNSTKRQSIQKYGGLDDITPLDVQEIADYYKTTVPFVQYQLEALRAYCGSTGRVYKNYKMALRSFVLRDIGRVGLKRLENRKEVVDATGIESL